MNLAEAKNIVLNTVHAAAIEGFQGREDETSRFVKDGNFGDSAAFAFSRVAWPHGGFINCTLDVRFMPRIAEDLSYRALVVVTWPGGYTRNVGAAQDAVTLYQEVVALGLKLESLLNEVIEPSELGADFFADPILTCPGEDLIEKVKTARRDSSE